MGKVLRYGMVGGGQGAFIGDAHRKSINLDGKASLVAGCFSRDYENTLQTGKMLNVDEDRLYKSYEEMAEAEGKRDEGIDFVVVVTPNYTHYDICKAFLENGIHVSCDKPLTVNVHQAIELKNIAIKNNIQFMVTYTYSGHVTAKHIRSMIAKGEIGEIRTVMGEYPQGWLADGDEKLNKQGAWRINPKFSGDTNCLGDIGTHIENTVAMMTGLKIKKVLARMEKVVEGRVLDDNSAVMIEYDSGVSGLYWASQIAIGHDNGLRIRIYGSKGSIEWFQEQPEVINIGKLDGTLTQLHRGHSGIDDSAAKYTRLPSGHSEGWFEAMANLYSNFIDCINLQYQGKLTESNIDYPTVDDGIDGIKFIEACLESAKDNTWIKL